MDGQMKQVREITSSGCRVLSDEQARAVLLSEALFNVIQAMEDAGTNPSCFYYCVYCERYFTPAPREDLHASDCLCGYPADGCPGCCDVTDDGMLVERSI